MTPHLTGRLLKTGAFMAASLVVCASAQDREIEVPSAAPPVGMETKPGDSAKPTTPALEVSQQKQLAKPQPPAAIQEILKMVSAGVSMEVIRAYVESAPTAYNPNASDMIALKQHGVPDEITMAFLKRSAEVRLQKSQGSATAAVPLSAESYNNRFFLDPESYDYFQYYYLYPRTLASAYERLGRYQAPYYPGFSGAFGPYSPNRRHFGSWRGVSSIIR